MEIRTRWCHCVLEGIGEISSTARQTVCQNFMAISFKATITDHLVHYHGRHRTEFKDFLPLVAIDIVGDHRNVGILYGCIDEAGK